MKLSAITSSVASASVICVRVRNLICRNRCRIDRINELLGLCCHSGSKQCTLAILRSGTSEIIVLSLQVRNLFIAKIVKNGPCPSVLAVNDISCVAVHSVLQCAGILSHVVVHALDCFSGFAAAVCKLCLERIGILHICYSVSVNSLLDAEAYKALINE